LLRFSFFVLSCCIVSSAAAQQQSASGVSKYATKHTSISQEGGSVSTPISQNNSFFVPMPDAISIQGANPIGIPTKYQQQTNHGGLHNVQVDPSNPLKVHAVIMEVPNVTAADTTTAANYPNRNCYYVFSSDGGVNWTTPKAVAKSRGGFPAMVLRKKANGDYVPVIAVHRNLTSLSDFVVALYMETGAPGDGNFVGMDADQKTGDGQSGDIIWASVAVSPDGTKAYVVGAFDDPSDASKIDDIQFGWFGLSDAGPTSWSKWSTGPDDGSFNGYTSVGEYSINVNAAGTVGVAWVSYNYTTPDRALYYAETKDLGATWINQTQLWVPTDSVHEAGGTPATYLIADGVDLLYEGNTPYIAFTAEDEEQILKATYIPESGTLGIWSPVLNHGAPLLLLTRTRANAYNTGTLPNSAFLSTWQKPTYVDPQGANIQYPTLAHVPKSAEWNIYFQAWVNSDTTAPDVLFTTGSGAVKTFDTVSEAYSSIYRMYSLDNGNSWTVQPVRSNNPDGSGKKFDYRFPEVSTFLPVIGGHQIYPILFAGDTVAGEFLNPGFPNWNIMDWYGQADTLGAPPSGVAIQNKGISLGLQPSFPNPFASSTKINFSLAEGSNVVLTVEDVLGRPIATLVNGPLGQGEHTATFNAGDLPNGVYSYTLRADGQSVSRSMSLIR